MVDVVIFNDKQCDRSVALLVIDKILPTVLDVVAHKLKSGESEENVKEAAAALVNAVVSSISVKGSRELEDSPLVDIWPKRGALKDHTHQGKTEINTSSAASSPQCDCAQKGKNQQTSINVVTHITTPLSCKGDGVDRVYHETMVKALRIELESLRSKIAINEIVAN